MDETINKWLQTYEPIKEIAEMEKVHNEKLTDTVKNLALLRTGFETLPLKYITDKGWYRQYQYLLLLKSASEVDEQRVTNLDWLDDFSNWFVSKNNTNDFPKLDKGRVVKKVSCANALTYQEGDDGRNSTYSLQIYFDIRKAE